jgi:uncharacterized protein (DUF58 family)
MAASLAAAALDDGLSVGLCGFAAGGWKAIPPKRGKNHRADLLSLLARLPASTGQPTSALLDACQPLLKSGTTPVLLTAHDLQLGLLEQSRGGMIVVSAMHASADAWFRFEPAIDFALTAPMEAQNAAVPSAIGAGVYDSGKRPESPTPALSGTSAPAVGSGGARP